MATFTFSQLEKLFNHPASGWLLASDLHSAEQSQIDLAEAKRTQARRLDGDLRQADRTQLPDQEQPIGRNT